MGVEVEILTQPKVHFFCTNFTADKGHVICNHDESFNAFASGI